MRPEFTPIDYETQLEAVGVSRTQAHVHAKALAAALSIVVTKPELDKAVQSLRTEIKDVDQRLTAKIEGVEQRLKGQIDALKMEMDSRFSIVNSRFDVLDVKIDGMKGEMQVMRWGLGVLCTLQAAILIKLIFL
jgi:hypothetical protein